MTGGNFTISAAGSGVVRIDPLHFLARSRKRRRLNQALSVLSVIIGFIVCILLFISNTFVLTLVCVCMCSVSWLLLVKLSVLAK